MAIYTASKPTADGGNARIRIDIDTERHYVAVKGIDHDMFLHFSTVEWIICQMQLAADMDGVEKVQTVDWTQLTGEKQ